MGNGFGLALCVLVGGFGMGAFAVRMWVVLGLVLGLPACLAGPQPDPPLSDEGRAGAARDAGEREDSGLGSVADAGAPAPPADPGVTTDADDGAFAGRSEAGEEAVDMERRTEIFDPERLLPGPSVPQDAGPDAGDHGDDADVSPRRPRGRRPRH